VNNLLYQAEKKGEDFKEENIQVLANELVEMCQRIEGHIVLVTNETGLGIMPENALARRYGDLCGRCNQIIAAAADHVYFMISGIAQKIK
jgi:adenosylcobinamide kinase/adenosylcobinamide-phosphate guanylyltransferase